MKPFHTIATPHKDILEGRLTMDVFAADLWEVSQKRGPEEYSDSETFFRKTYMTQGLQNLLDVIERRLAGKGSDPVVQIQTPFGGGKTHALIAMFHKAVGWNAKRIVIVGTALGTKETLWGLIEKQLTGKITKFKGQAAPGKESLRELLSQNQPILILMDEVLEYMTKAAGVKVAESSLASQTIAFMQELTETVGTLEKACLVITLPSSIIEHYDENAEKLYLQLQKVAGRVEKIYTPVQENEITKIIRRRLFNRLKDKDAKEIVSAFIEYADREGILPPGELQSEYRDRFLDSYPFIPEVMDVLYHRWGSFPTFQRTRGVLRLLSLVIYSLKETNKPYLSLADFDLSNQQIRQELLKHIGQEYNSIIDGDISGGTANSKIVDKSLGDAYKGIKLGTRSATTIFLYSFSGGKEHGATVGEIKRSATTTENPAAVITEATAQLKDRLFYLQSIGEKYFFSNQPNLNRILLKYLENIPESELRELELELLQSSISRGKFKPFVWEEKSSNIPDSEDLKFVILRKENNDIIQNLLQTKGQTPRVNRNTLFIICPLESEKPGFINNLKCKIAYQYIGRDKSLSLTEDQKKEIKQQLKKLDAGLYDSLRRYYRTVVIPAKDGFKTEDLGIPTYGEKKQLINEVYEKLRSASEILEKIAPLVIREKFLSQKDYVHTEQLYQSSLRTPGETRYLNRQVLERGIKEGIEMGLFGLGELEDDKLTCRYFKQPSSVSMTGKEVIIKEDVCLEQLKKKEPATAEVQPGTTAVITDIPTIEPGVKEKPPSVPPSGKLRDSVQLQFHLPKGKVAGMMGVMNLLQSKFDDLEIRLIATGGLISDQDYQDKIEEAFRQLGIKFEEEKK